MLFDNALKIVWVKRLCANDERPWKFIPLSLLSIGASLLFQCNYDIQYLPLNENLPKFYREIISHWQKIKNTNPKTKGDVLNQIIWNNRFIRVNKSSVFFFPGWNKVGIEKLSCLFDNESNTLLTFTTFMQKYNVKSNFLQYYSLLSAIPQEWKTLLKQEMFSTINGIRPTFNRKAHMQNNLQYFTQSPALPSTNCREKTH